MQKLEDREIEVKFLEIDLLAMKKRLTEAGAMDLGEDDINEIIFYDKDFRWLSESKFVRIRQTKKGARLTFKQTLDEKTADGTIELEFGVDDRAMADKFLQAVGLTRFREQEKKRHSFRLGEVMVDIDTWPGVPTYLELEGPSEQALKEAALKLGLDWKDAHFGTAWHIIEEKYHIPVRSYRHFTFKKQG
ncbi:MAG: class IV adenylate cyclase [Patescibacteria group bacterium]